jgi:hypothetical protein
MAAAQTNTCERTNPYLSVGVTDQIYDMDDGTTGLTTYTGPTFAFSTNNGYTAACSGGYYGYYGNYICNVWQTACTYAVTMYVRNEADPETSEVSLTTSGATGFTWIQKSGTANVQVNRSDILAGAVSNYKNRSYVVHWKYEITSPGTVWWD